MDSLEKAIKIGKIIDDKKGEDVAVLKVAGITSITDYYVIATAKNTVHAKSLCDEIEEKLKKCDVVPNNIEGYQSAMWILMDYGNVIVHIFYEETRKFYDLERLWMDAERITTKNDNI
ncbi:MAG: ribosome silencing factor [Ruminococcaceae bacterium]|nr:ribosome silencing factor [Oscillospiraceae bacterium]